MGATASSSQRDSRCEEDAAAEQRTAGASDARDDGSTDDTLLQRNGQVSSFNLKTKNNADEVTGHFEERVLADEEEKNILEQHEVCSGFVTLKEDGTETLEDFQDVVSLQPNTKNEGRDMNNADGITVGNGNNEETVEIKEVNNINEVGFKKVFRFVGLKFTLQKDTCEKTEGEWPLANDQEERVASTSEDPNDTKNESIVAANENSLFTNTHDEVLKTKVFVQTEAAEPSQKTENATELDEGTRIVEHNVEITPENEQANVVEASPESEEPMSPIKQFFTQGIFASLRKKKKEDEIKKETKEEELTRIDKIEGVDESEGAEQVDSKCMCLDIPYIMYEEEKDSQQKGGSKLFPEGELQNSLEKDKVQESPLKRLFRKFSTRRQREIKENVIEAGGKVIDQPESSLELTEVQIVEEPVVGETKPAVEEQVADVSPQESKKKSDSSVSWEALICGSSAKKRARKTNEGDTPDKGEENEKTTESPLGSSTEGDYDHLTSSNEQDEKGEAGSAWKTFKKIVTPKRKVRTGESSSSEHIPSDSEMNKDDSFSMKKLIPGLKKRKSDERQEQTSSDETGKDAETGDEDDETPAIIPLSEYEIIEPESMKEVNEKLVEITIEHEKPEVTSQGLEQDTVTDYEPKLAGKVSNNAGPLIIHVLSEDFEELTDFLSKHQQLSDIPEEGIIEESIETPISSAEWTTQDDTLAEDIVDLTADAVTALEPASEELSGDNSTEMVSAVSQLTESPRTSGHVTPVSAEYGMQMSNMILQEAVQSVCMIPSVESVATKDESQESVAVSFSPYIIQSTTTGETKVFVAHMKTKATAICTGLVSQEIESVEELVSAPLLEAIPEVSDALLTELVSGNLTDASEVAGLGTDEVYEAKISEVKTECQEVIMTNKEEEAASETELDVEQVIQLMEVAEESHVVHVVDKNEECLTEPVTGIELRSLEMTVIDTMQSKAVLDQILSEYTHGPETEGPLHSMLEEPANGQPVQYTEVTAEVDEELEISDANKLEDKVQIEKVELLHVNVPEIQVDIKDAISNTAGTELESVPEVVLAGDSAVIVEDIGEKMEETGDGKIAQHEINDIPAEQSRDVVALHITETTDELLAKVQFEEKQLYIASKEVSLLEKVLVEETENEDKFTTELDVTSKEIDTDVVNLKVEESASEEADSINTAEKVKLAVKEGQPFTNIESNESENQEVSVHINISKVSPEIIEQDVGTNNIEITHAIRVTVVSEDSEDVLEHKEIPTEPQASSNVMPTHLKSVMPQVMRQEVETVEWSQDIEHRQETFKNEQPVTIFTTESTTKQSDKEKSIEVQPVVQAPAKSELPKAKEQKEDISAMTQISAETISGGQMDRARLMTATEIIETAVPEIKDKIPLVTELEPESLEPAVIEVTVTAVSESVIVAQNNAAVQMENNSVNEQRDEAIDETRLKCEPLEQLIEKPLAMELQVEKAKIKDEIPAVMYLKEEAFAVTTPEVEPIVQVPPLTSESKATTPEVTLPEIQTQEAIEEAIELRATTLEITEPEVETPVVTEVRVKTAVVTELGVETPVVTSVVTELEVETPVVTSMAETIDTHNSAVTSLSQNTDIDTSMLETVVKKQVVGVPIVTPVIVTSAAALDLVTPVMTLGNRSGLIAPVEDTSVVPLVAEVQPVNPAIEPVEMQNVIPMVETPAINSLIATEAAPTVEITATVTMVAETSVVSPVLETVVSEAVVPVTVVKPTADFVAKSSAVIPVVEMPDVNPVVQTPTVGSVVVAPAITPVVETPAVVLVTDAVPLVVVTPAVTQETSVVSPVVETPVTSITTVNPTLAAMAQTPVDETPDKVSVTVKEAVTPGLVAPAVTPVADILFVSPAVEPPAVIPTAIAVAETSPVTAVVETSGLVSVMATEAASPVVTPAVTARAETSVPVVEISAVKSNAVSVAETPDLTPVVQTPALVSVIVREAAPVVIPTVTAVVEISVVETPSNPTATPVMSPEVTTLPAVSVKKTPTVTLPAETQVVDVLAETFAGTSVSEALQVNPEVETPAVASVVVTPAMSPVIVTPDVFPVLKETMLQVVEQGKKETNTEPSVEAEHDVKPPLVIEKEVKTPVLTQECISNEELQQIPMVTSTEPQSGVEEDVWEDAVDNIGGGQCLMTQRVAAPQETAATQVSDAEV